MMLGSDTIDDVPDKVAADGFSGFDATTEATKLTPAIIRAGSNVWMDVDNLVQTRPGLRFNTLLTRAALGGGSHSPRGAGYYDTPGREAVLVSGDGKLYEITDDANNAASNVLAPTPSASADAYFAQLVDRMFWSDGTLRWSLYSGGAWSHGTVTTFSDASPMPTWKMVCAHGFRLLAYDPASDKIYASDVALASAAANWSPTANIRVGTGEGDPVQQLISGQGGNLIVVKERSAWMVDTSSATVSNWTSRRITNLAGAIEGKTAVQVGQDVIFLSALGVLSLGALATTDSISPAVTLSTPVQRYLNRVNMAAISTAWAVMWRDLYLLAVPLDDATTPDTILPFNVKTRQWGAPWTATLPTLTVSATNLPFTGFVCGVTANFGRSQETIIFDNTGRALRLDRDFEKDEYSAGVTQEIESWLTTKAFTHEQAEHYKQPFWMQADFFGSSAANVQINLVRDGLRAYPDKALVDCEKIADVTATNSLQSFPIRFPYGFQPNESYTRNFTIRNMNRYKSAGIQIFSAQGRLKLRAIRLASFMDEAALV